MGLLKNILVGGSRPTKDDEVIRCGDCREIIQPDAKRCPNCNAKIFTMRGRIIRRTAAFIALLALFGTSAGGITGAIMGLIALVMIGIGLYYLVQRPVHHIRPPHRPTRRPDEVK